MTISRYQPETDKEELVRSISLGDINNLQPGWKLLVGCGHSLSWSPDFTKLLVTGRTNQAELSAQAGGFHVFLIDFSQTTITDLTAARQTSGFSAAAAVNDTMPGFVSENATNKVSIGSNMVMFSDNGIPKILDVQSPKGVTPADVTPSAIKLHPEYRLWLQGGGEFNAVSPDGKYLFERGTGITPAGDYSAVGTACPGVERPDIIGWTDSTHVVVTYGQYVGLMAVKDLGLSCESLIPAIGEGKTIGPVELMLDRQHISVALSGGELYSISTSLPASEPKAIQPPRLPDSLVVLFRPGNY